MGEGEREDRGRGVGRVVGKRMGEGSVGKGWRWSVRRSG